MERCTHPTCPKDAVFMATFHVRSKDARHGVRPVDRAVCAEHASADADPAPFRATVHPELLAEERRLSRRERKRNAALLAGACFPGSDEWETTTPKRKADPT